MSRAKYNPQIPLNYIEEDVAENEDDPSEDGPEGDPCPHCGSFLIVYEDDPENVVCPNCHLTPDGDLDTPDRRDTDDSRNYLYYRKSEKAIMYGAYPAYMGDDEYGLNDDSADYDSFLSS